jgi:NAD(P)-dependent dehydrogenase (short-subunit alcohol dehydrogenase family)
MGPIATPSTSLFVQAHQRFAGVDIVVNKAGYGQFGMIEDQQSRALSSRPGD